MTATAARLVITSPHYTRHAVTVEQRDTIGGRAVCGATGVLFSAAGITAPGTALLEATIVLNDLHLEGADVCPVCRARLSVAALAGAEA